MCQLLGMNCNVPTDICFSFSGFHHRGGRTDQHVDGWGIAFYEGPGCRLFIDTKPAAESPVAALVRNYPIRSLNVIAHIRKATVGNVAIENTHPFVREMWGRYWTLAHNGTLKGFAPRFNGRYRRYIPVGRTDSELAFCHILETLRRLFPAGQPELPALYGALANITAELAAFGDFQLPALERRRVVRLLREAARLHRAQGAIHHGASRGRRLRGGLQPADDTGGPGCRDCHRAAHRQRGLDHHGAG